MQFLLLFTVLVLILALILSFTLITGGAPYENWKYEKYDSYNYPTLNELEIIESNIDYEKTLFFIYKYAYKNNFRTMSSEMNKIVSDIDEVDHREIKTYISGQRLADPTRLSNDNYNNPKYPLDNKTIQDICNDIINFKSGGFLRTFASFLGAESNEGKYLCNINKLAIYSNWYRKSSGPKTIIDIYNTYINIKTIHDNSRFIIKFILHELKEMLNFAFKQHRLSHSFYIQVSDMCQAKKAKDSISNYPEIACLCEFFKLEEDNSPIDEQLIQKIKSYYGEWSIIDNKLNPVLEEIPLQDGWYTFDNQILKKSNCEWRN